VDTEFNWQNLVYIYTVPGNLHHYKQKICKLTMPNPNPNPNPNPYICHLSMSGTPILFHGMDLL